MICHYFGSLYIIISVVLIIWWHDRLQKFFIICSGGDKAFEFFWFYLGIICAPSECILTFFWFLESNVKGIFIFQVDFKYCVCVFIWNISFDYESLSIFLFRSVTLIFLACIIAEILNFLCDYYQFLKFWFPLRKFWLFSEVEICVFTECLGCILILVIFICWARYSLHNCFSLHWLVD